jgi:signal transduction histidine kinase/ligand-binding sensor domain-containing protein
VRNGFSRGAIGSIAQTPDGYLWLGTEFGLLRFDGLRAFRWQPPAGEQLPSNYIRSLLVARDGTLWIGTQNGLARWKDGKLTQHSELAGVVVNSLLQDRAGTVWVGIIEPGNGTLCAIQAGIARCHESGSLGNGVGALYEDRKGNLWVASDAGLWRWAPGPSEQYAFRGGPVYVDGLVEDDSGSILMATSDGLKQLVGGTIRSYGFSGFATQFRPNRLFRSRDGSLWVATQQGLLHVRQGRVDRFTAADGLSGDFVNGILEDREGNLWVSTLDGLDRFREFAVPTISSKQGLSSSGAWSVQATPDGSIWIGGPRGLHRWENGAVSEVANSRLSGAVRSLGRDDRGRLWVSTASGVFYSEGSRFMPVPGVPGGNILSITADSNATVWISNGDAGLFSLTPAGAVQQIMWDQLGQSSAAEPLLPDRAHAGLWLGFANGIVFLNDGRIGASYNSARVTHLLLGSDGAVWAATEGGLSRVKDGRITTLTSTNGLPCDAVHWAIDDDNESFWLYTPCGLVRIARSELDAWVNDSKKVVRTTVFDGADGVRSVGRYGGYGPHVTKSADGKIWFLPGDGVSVIDPRNFPVNKLPPPVHIEQVIADRMSYAAASGLRLPPLIRDLQIDYTALSLVAPEKNRFRIRLEGWDQDWQDVGTRRQVFYSNLPAGNYRFRVIASNNSGVWNETGAALDFSFAPAFYQTFWFRTLAVVTFLSLLWAAYRIRLRVLREAVTRQLQGDFVSAVSHEFRSPLTAMRQLTELLAQGRIQDESRRRMYYDVLLKETSRLHQLVEDLLDFGRMDAGRRHYQFEPVDVSRLVEDAVHEYHREADANRHRIEFAANSHPLIVDADREALKRVVRNLLENAVKYSPGAVVVWVETACEGRTALLRVRDEGIGVPPEEQSRIFQKFVRGEAAKRACIQGTGIGLSMVKEIVGAHHGQVTLQSEVGRGSTFIVQLPLSAARDGRDA